MNFMNMLQSMMGNNGFGNMMGNGMNPLQMVNMLGQFTGTKIDPQMINDKINQFGTQLIDTASENIINKLYDFYPSDKLDDLFAENPERKDKEKALVDLFTASMPRFFKELKTEDIDKLYHFIENRKQ